jgi:hypothetical protein
MKLVTDFLELESKVQVNILARLYFIMKSQRDESRNKNSQLDSEIKEIKHESQINFQRAFEAYKQENYVLRCDIEELNMKIKEEAKKIEDEKIINKEKKKKHKDEERILLENLSEKEKYLEKISKEIEDYKNKVYVYNLGK